MNRMFKRGLAVALSTAIAVSGSVILERKSDVVKAADGYELVWSDEFNGNSLNRANWNVEVNGYGGWNNELQYYCDSSENIKVSDGTLKITALKKNYNNKQYTSARLNSEGKVSVSQGKIEARMKLPSFKGAWPAFWMMGANGAEWPKCGEIDILETINDESIVYGTAHWAAGNSYKSSGSSTYEKGVKIDITEWHTYGIEWDDEKIVWYVDNIKYFTLDIASDSNREALKKDMYILLNLAIGGDWPGFNIDDSAIPATMEVDYVRAYKLVDEEVTTKVPETTKEPETTEEPEGSNVAKGKEAYVSGNEGDNVAAKYAIDGDKNTRWSSKFVDNSWIYVDLGKEYNVNKVILTWEAAYGRDYDIQVSNDGKNWTTVKSLNNQDGNEDVIEFNAVKARYVKMNGVKRATGYGYSLWEFEVYSNNTPTETESKSETETVTQNPSVSGKNVALNCNTAQSGSEATAMSADKAVDGNKGTRWSSNFNDDAWMSVDLGKIYEINKVLITWENAYGKAYDIQISTDGINWTTVKELRDQDGGEDIITFDAVKARFVKMQGVKRAMGYGYSIWDFQVIAK